MLLIAANRRSWPHLHFDLLLLPILIFRLVPVCVFTVRPSIDSSFPVSRSSRSDAFVRIEVFILFCRLVCLRMFIVVFRKQLLMTGSVFFLTRPSLRTGRSVNQKDQFFTLNKLTTSFTFFAFHIFSSKT